MDSLTDVQYVQQKIAALKTEHQEFLPLWREIAEKQAPTRGRFLETKQKRAGEKKYAKILNNVAGRALRDATSGIFAGTASKATKWFTLETFNPELMRLDAVRTWIYQAEESMRAVLGDSNFYSEYPVCITELLLFGTSAMSQLPSDTTITRFHTHTIGSYLIANNSEGVVDTIVYTTPLTPRQILQKYPETTPEQLRTPAMQMSAQTYEVSQLVEPNPNYNPDKLLPEFKRFRSIHFLHGVNDTEAILRKSGFDKFPTYVVRWSVADDYAFGVDCPGMVALSDVNSLQQREKDKAKAIDRHVRPKLKGPASLSGMKLNDKESDIVIYDADNSREGLSPIFQVDPRIQEMRQDIEAIEQAVLQSYFVDLFRAISSMQGIQPRNQLELSQRNAEALLLLGPVLERVQRELLSNVLATTFSMCMEANVFSEMPPELEDGALNIRFISSLAQAQRSQDLAALGDFTQFAGAVASALPYVADKIDGDANIDLYTNLRGVNPLVNRDQEAVGKIREAQAQAAQQARQLENEQKAASANVQNASAEKARAEISGQAG